VPPRKNAGDARICEYVIPRSLDAQVLSLLQGANGKTVLLTRQARSSETVN
jgi:hypothetical protein